MFSLNLKDYLNITTFGSSLGEYKIRFIDKSKFLKDVKHAEEIEYDFGNGYYNSNIELANLVAGFVKPYKPNYSKLVLKTIYLRNQREERPTENCQADLFKTYLDQFIAFDAIRVPHIHNPVYYHDKLEVVAPEELYRLNGNIIFPDEGIFQFYKDFKKWAEICNSKNTLSNSYTFFKKERIEDSIVSACNDINFIMENNDFVIFDDIIAGGDSIIAAVKEILQINSKAKITIKCIFLMSDYGRQNILKHLPNVKIEPIYDLEEISKLEKLI